MTYFIQPTVLYSMILITINSIILYFKHIIHIIIYIDAFPLNGHPPSMLVNGWLALH